MENGKDKGTNNIMDDLFNAVRNYQDSMTANDAILIIAYNNDDGDLLTGIDGDWQILSTILSTDEAININSVEDAQQYKHLKESILNIAANILNTNDEYRIKFINQFKSGFVDIGANDYQELKIISSHAPPSDEGV